VLVEGLRAHAVVGADGAHGFIAGGYTVNRALCEGRRLAP
jgi:hypothetical protein